MAQTRIKVTVKGVYMQRDGETNNHFVLFEDEHGRQMPMFIGQFEAWAISLALEGDVPDRPFTHDTLMAFLAITGSTLEEAYINDLRDETFYALLVVRVGDQRHELDLRPSDAVTFALRAKVPIFISEEVFTASAQTSGSKS